MKHVLALLAVLGLGMASGVHAEEAQRQSFRFSYHGNHGGNFSMVSCDYASSQLVGLLDLFGATEIDVRCHGGITPGGIFPLSLSAEYSAPVTDESTPEQVAEYHSDHWNQSCYFNTGLVRKLVKHSPNVRILRKNDACFSFDSRYSYTFSIRKPN